MLGVLLAVLALAVGSAGLGNVDLGITVSVCLVQFHLSLPSCFPSARRRVQHERAVVLALEITAGSGGSCQMRVSWTPSDRSAGILYRGLPSFRASLRVQRDMGECRAECVGGHRLSPHPEPLLSEMIPVARMLGSCCL